MPFAEQLISVSCVETLGECLSEVAPDRSWAAVRAVAGPLADLGLAARAEAVRDALAADLPDGYRASADIIARALEDPAFTGWMIWPVTEGTRPRLPWAKRVPALSARPEVTLPVLDALCADPSEFVRRSVANHLNDISRIDPDLAVATATRWGTVNGELPATVRHGLRTLVKQADPGALALLGFGSARDLRVDGPRLRAPRVAVGQALEFDYTVVNAGPVPLTTRRHYLGQHALELQVNGTRHGHVSFDLLMPEPADR